MFIISSTIWEGERPIEDGGYHETEDIDEVCDAVRSALENGATQIHISRESYSSEGIENPYED